MTTEEVINELNSLVKPYIGKVPQSTYSRTLRDIKNGNCKPKTMQEFFAKFGYEQNEVTWKRK
jgi:enoyl reductase-like protein